MTFRHLYPIILFFLLTLCTSASAGELRVKDFTFSHLGTLEGLSSQRVYSLHKTKDNAIWWTTKHGVDRSNGTVVTNYPLGGRNPYSSFAGLTVKFAHSTTTSDDLIAFENTGNIYRYNRIQDRFELILSVAKSLGTEVKLNDVLVTDNCMWLAMLNGVYQVMTKDGNKIKDTGNKFYNNYILPYGNGKLLFCGRKGVYDANNRKWSDDNVISGYYDRQTNNLWLGTFNNGVKVVKNVGKNQSVVTLNVPTNPVKVITPYDSRNMLIGIDGFGVYQALRHGGEAQSLFTANDGPNGVLHGNGVYDIIVDGWNNIVVASYSGGIDMARPVGSTTAIFRHIMNNTQSIINDHVNCVEYHGSDLLLMGTDDGISFYDMARDEWRHSSRGMVVLDMCKKPDGNLLIATYGNGVCEVARDGSTRKVYSTADGTLKDDHVYRLSYDKAGNLWMGMLFGSLTVKTPEGNRYFSVDNILALRPLSDGRMAIGSAHGLYLLGVNDKEPKEVNYMPQGKTDANRYVTDIYEDMDHNLWIATDGGGVYVYEMKSGRVTYQVTTDDGLPSNSVTSITKDETGRIWLGTEKGLVFVNPNRPDEVINVSYCYGLNTEYVQHAVSNLPNGDIIYGTVDGAIIINPKNITRLNFKAHLTIKGVHVHGWENRPDTDLDDFRARIAEGLKHGEINLSYHERSFDVLYESINLRNQFDLGYQYKMEGMEWSKTITQQFLGFENLEAGTHILHIRCISKTSGAVLGERKVTIHISQPWWNSWWMWCIYVLLILAACQGGWWMYNLHNKYLRLMRERIDLPEDAGQGVAGDRDASAGAAVTDLTEVALREKEEEDDDEPESEAAKDEGREFVGMATKVTLDNIKDNDFTIDDLCREMGMSRTLFYVKLKTYTGKSPQDFVRAIRLEKAASLLRKGRSVTDVSVLTGFDNPKYFSTVFKKYFGVSPSKYE